MDIADKIKFLRTNILDLSQDKFAKKIDVTRSTINNPLELSVRDINDEEYQILPQIPNYFNNVNKGNNE